MTTSGRSVSSVAMVAMKISAKTAVTQLVTPP